MAHVSKIVGFDRVMKNLNVELIKIKGRTAGGLIKAAAFVRSDMEATAPTTPVDLGNLRASWFATTATQIAHGKGISRFKGSKAGILASEHSSMLTEAKALAGKDRRKITLILGYSANYALWVHEKIGAKFKRPGAGPKWFEAAMKRNSKKIIRIVADNAKIR